MTTPLFRTESLQYQQQRLWGDVVLFQPLSIQILAAFVVLATSIGLAYLVMGNYNRTENVLGYIAPTDGVAQLYAERGGTVTRILVSEGDRVKKGQPLLEIATAAQGTAGKLGKQLQEQNRLRLEEIDKQLNAARRRFGIEERRLMSGIEGGQSDVNNIRSRLLVEKQLYGEIEADAARWDGLAEKGMVSRTDASKLRQQVLNQLSRVRELEQLLTAKESDLRNAHSILEMVPYDREEKLSGLRTERTAIEQALAQLELPDAYILEAPFDGTVAALQAGRGQVPVVNTPLISVVPEQAATAVHLLVPSRAAGIVDVGQEVLIRVDAFPFQRFGHIKGKVAQVSRSVYRPDELSAPVAIQEAVYKVIVIPSANFITAYGEDRALAPGMTLSADIIVSRGSLFDFMIDPLRAKLRNVRQS